MIKKPLDSTNARSELESKFMKYVNVLPPHIQRDKSFKVFLSDIYSNYSSLGKPSNFKESILNSLADNFPGIFTFIDKDYRYKYVSPNFSSWFGITWSNIKDKYVSEIFGEDIFRQNIKPNLDKALAGEVVEVFRKFPTINFDLKEVRSFYFPVENEMQEIIGVCVFTEDLTEINPKDSIIIISNTILESSTIGFEIIDSQFESKIFSDSGMRLLSLTEKEKPFGLLGKIADEYREKYLRDLKNCFQSQKIFTEVYQLHLANEESPFYVECRFSIVKDGIYKDCVLVSFSDATEKTLAKIELEKKNKQLEQYIQSNIKLEQFAHIASHDLKSPLRTVSSFSSLLKSKISSKLSQKEREYFEFIEEGANKMSELINDLLDYSTVNAQSLKVEEFKVVDLLDEVISNLDFLIKERNAKIEIKDLDQFIIADKSKLKQIFQNLVSNALKFVGPKVSPEMSISMQDHKQYWQFTVTDNGIGIKKKNQLGIFEAFKRLHSESEYEGTGLGLAICKTLVEKHQGEIWVESEIGKGSAFCFTIRKYFS